ncbi:MAG: LemA family protein [Candidatus Aenigmatarchaeota archaeon]
MVGILGLALIALGVIIIVGIILFVIAVYNSLVRFRFTVRKAFSNIGVLLKQRRDEITKLLPVVRKYMKYEQETFLLVTRARSVDQKARTIKEKAAADNLLTSALKTLFAVAEAYPNLKADESFRHLRERITGLENEIRARRESYNDAVKNYNVNIRVFPNIILAGPLGFRKQDFFKATEKDMKDVQIKFGEEPIIPGKTKIAVQKAKKKMKTATSEKTRTMVEKRRR